MHTLSDNSAFVNPAGQLLLTRWGKTRMDGVGIVFEFYTGPLLRHLYGQKKKAGRRWTEHGHGGSTVLKA